MPHQVTDTGLDETSCFFIDNDGEETPHGHYFEELAYPFSSSTGEGGYFYDVSTGGFQGDSVEGHGTHTAGSALGATLNTPAETTTCSETTKDPGCVGGCIDADRSSWGDDLVSLPAYSPYGYGADVDRICPMLGCDDETAQWCVSDDVGETLAENGGMARGAKLAFVDVFDVDDTALVDYAGNGLWEPCLEAGCKVHSNSWGGAPECFVTSLDIVYDDFMYKHPENLLLFAAGNDGDIVDGRACTISSPGIGKNTLTVGATSSGETRLTSTSADGGEADGTNGYADVDTLAFFSSYGPTRDSRIKPEILAPGDAIYSASSDGEDTHSCRLAAFGGTSMSTPIAAGASAMVRQYFMEETFYLADVTARGWCNDGGRECEAFSASSATVKALLINSANLMGGSPEPEYHRGFGRIHLEMGMPLGGEGSLALFVADRASLPELSSQDFSFDVDADAGLDFRATLSWIDPPASSSAVIQLVHDLDLEVVSPSGTTHVMWASSGEVDTSNVNERVIVAAADVESGTWTVRVSTKGLLTDSQDYSLVVNGAIVFSSSEPFYASFIDSAPSAAGSMASTPMSLMSLLVGAVASTIAAASAA
ncbi:unnamed protein product [Laminaria digitata]